VNGISVPPQAGTHAPFSGPLGLLATGVYVRLSYAACAAALLATIHCKSRMLHLVMIRTQRTAHVNIYIVHGIGLDQSFAIREPRAQYACQRTAQYAWQRTARKTNVHRAKTRRKRQRTTSLFVRPALCNVYTARWAPRTDGESGEIGRPIPDLIIRTVEKQRRSQHAARGTQRSTQFTL